MKKMIVRASALIAIAVGAWLAVPKPAAAQHSEQPCRNSCRQSYESCLDEAQNPGGINQCRKAYTACLESC